MPRSELPTRTTPDGTVTVCPTCKGDGRYVAFDTHCPAEWAHHFIYGAAPRRPTALQAVESMLFEEVPGSEDVRKAREAHDLAIQHHRAANHTAVKSATDALCTAVAACGAAPLPEVTELPEVRDEDIGRFIEQCGASRADIVEDDRWQARILRALEWVREGGR